MKTMTFVLFTSATVCICVACGGDAQSDVANGVAAREDKARQLAQKSDTPKTAVDRKALPPIKEPVHESGEPKKLAVTFIHTRQMEGKSFTKGMSLARRNFGTLTGMYQYESVRQVHPNAPAELYLEMAVSYLVLGRFDTAIAYLERGQKKSPPKGSFARTYKTIYEHAKNVKATLTQARDALRKKGVDVKYPDERIFLQAFATAPANDHYLLMNIADAQVEEFPTSENARKFVAELNLGFFEDFPRKTNIPEVRHRFAHKHGQNTLDWMQRWSPRSVYPTMRMMHSILRTTVPRKNRGAVSRVSKPRFMSAVTSTLDLHPNLTDADRAFLLFGSVVVSLQTPRGWEVGNADHLVTKLEKAVKYDPKNKQYATTLARVRAKKDEITRIKRAQYKSRAGSGDIVGSYFPKSKERGPGGDIFSDFQRRVWNILVDQVRKSPGNTFHADLLDSVGCPTCLGNGKGIYDGRTCPTCRGTGKCSAVKEK